MCILDTDVKVLEGRPGRIRTCDYFRRKVSPVPHGHVWWWRLPLARTPCPCWAIETSLE